MFVDDKKGYTMAEKFQLAEEYFKLFFNVLESFAENTLCQFPWWNKLVEATAIKKVNPAV